MADFHSYDYRSNSNVVLTAKRQKRDGDEPTGAVESLASHLDGSTRMGDLAGRARPAELQERLARLRSRQGKSDGGSRKSRRAGASIVGRDTVLSSTFDPTSKAVFTPRSKASVEAYESLLTVVAAVVGDVQQDVLEAAAEEVLAVVHDINIAPRDAQAQIQSVLGAAGALAQTQYADLVKHARHVADYGEWMRGTLTGAAAGEDAAALDDELGVAVVFGDDDDDRMLSDDDSFYSDEDLGIPMGGAPAGGDGDGDGDDATDAEGASPMASLEPFMDAKYVENLLTAHLPVTTGAARIASLSERVMRLLSETSSLALLENGLMALLDARDVRLIGRLARERAKIVWGARLGEASGGDARDAVKEAMFAASADDAAVARLYDALFPAEGGAGGGVAEETQEISLEALASGVASADHGATVLPQESYRTSHDTYDAVHIPAPPPFEAPADGLIAIEGLPVWMQPAFGGLSHLNYLQSLVYPRVAEGLAAGSEAPNMLVCAPTGSGKTNVAVLCILSAMAQELEARVASGGLAGATLPTVIYVAPMKSLVAEITASLRKRFSAYNPAVLVGELSGDVSMTRQQLAETSVIVTTPEKYDIITRKSQEARGTHALVIIDEIHLLHDERGPVLEAIVARAMRTARDSGASTRIVGLSATLPNYQDIATFLRVPDTHVFHLGGECRPCPLQQTYLGVTTRKALERHQVMNALVWEQVKGTDIGSTLVFVHSRKDTYQTARWLIEKAMEEHSEAFLASGSASREILEDEARDHVRSPQLAEVLRMGVGIHHAGLCRSDRLVVEALFAARHLKVLVCTATLAWGVNLPARRVVIKGTQVYRPDHGAWTELSFLDVLQMLGRAGRPGLDTSGQGVLITTEDQLSYYLALMNEQMPIESQLLTRLPDVLNGECVLGNVASLDDAVDWLRYTYLWVRTVCSPEQYGLGSGTPSADAITTHLRQVAWSALRTLERSHMIRLEARTGRVEVLGTGRVASHYYLSHASVDGYLSALHPNITEIDLLRVFATSGEFAHVTVRQAEKVELAALLERVPIPVKEAASEASAKINVLLQVYVSKFPLEGFALAADMVYVTQSAVRLLRALVELALGRGWAMVARRLLRLCCEVEARQWSAQSPIRQVMRRGRETAVVQRLAQIPGLVERLERKAVGWAALHDLSPQELGELVQNARAGKDVYRAVHHYPRVVLEASVQPCDPEMLVIELGITADFAWNTALHGQAQWWWVWVEDVDGVQCLHRERWCLTRQAAEAGEEQRLRLHVPIQRPLPPQYFVRCISEQWLHASHGLAIPLSRVVVPAPSAALAGVADVAGLPVADAVGGVDAFAEVMRGALQRAGVSADATSPMVTQAWETVFGGDDNALVTGAPGSGVSALVEAAILRAIATHPKHRPRVVVLCARREQVALRAQAWQAGALGRLVRVGALATVIDGVAALRVLTSSDVVVAWAPAWEGLARGWRKRKAVRGVHLYVVDGIDAVGCGEAGAALEVVLSRVRLMCGMLTKNPPRVVAVGSALRNAADVADWLGVPRGARWCWGAGAREVPLVVKVHALPGGQATRRKKVWRTVRDAACPTVVWCATGVRGAAVGYVTWCAGVPAEVPEASVAGLGRLNRDLVPAGVAVLEATQPEAAVARVCELFATGVVRVVFAALPMVWRCSLRAPVVVVAGVLPPAGGDQDEEVEVEALAAVRAAVGGAGPAAGEPGSGTAHIVCEERQRVWVRRGVFEAPIVESQLETVLADALCAEIGSGTIENKQDAVDYLTWSFMYYRLAKNPNYYGQTGATHRHLSDFLSDTVENALGELEAARMIEVGSDGMTVTIANLGLIASYYQLAYTTCELIDESIGRKAGRREVLRVVANAAEWQAPEDTVLGLLQPWWESHGERQRHKRKLGQAVVLAHRLCLATVDIVSSRGHLKPVLAAMELAQACVQGVADVDAQLWQLPHASPGFVGRCAEADVDGVEAFVEIEDEGLRARLLGPEIMQDTGKLGAVAAWCNDLPIVELDGVEEEELVVGADRVASLRVTFDRGEGDEEDDEDEEEGEKKQKKQKKKKKKKKRGKPVHTHPVYGVEKDEGWWVVVGDSSKNRVYGVRRVVDPGVRVAECVVEWECEEEGVCQVWLVSDGLCGVDKEYELRVRFS